MFGPGADARLAALVEMCKSQGLDALVPTDPTISKDAEDLPLEIFRSNIGLLRRADGMIANLAPFRGAEPDSGTVFEVGFAFARGIPIVGYGVPEGPYWERVAAACGIRRGADGQLVDPNGSTVEDFGLPLNLMLARAVDIVPTAEDAIREMAIGIAGGRAA